MQPIQPCFLRNHENNLIQLIKDLWIPIFPLSEMQSSIVQEKVSPPFYCRLWYQYSCLSECRHRTKSLADDPSIPNMGIYRTQPMEKYRL